MDPDTPLPLLGGLTPAQFMRRHWQRKPLLVRNALPRMRPLLGRAALFELAGQEGVESRLVSLGRSGWQLKTGPFSRRALPPVLQARWTLLVQGVDLHLEPAQALLQQFSFVPQARLDDLMVSWASDGGGVGPHFDSYDVFLLQAQGRRRWRWGRQKDLSLREGLPLKILDRFEPEDDQLLEPGDMLYLPPRYAHDGTAVGECQTYSIGFRAPARGELARELLERLADDAAGVAGAALYSDAGQPAVTDSGRIPPPLQAFAADALQRALRDPLALGRALGELLSEPKPDVWFDAAPLPGPLRAVVLDRRTRMFYDDRHLFVNGESWRAAGADARLMRRLADTRRLTAADVDRASNGARDLLLAWCEAGWAHGETS